jgi:SAM-dependent methyltransferase
MSDDILDRPCAVCGETRAEGFRIWFDGFVKLYKCLTCGFVAQYPGPGEFAVVTDYQDFGSLDFVNEGQEFVYPERRRVLSDICDRAIAHQPSGKVLDVGCGDGHFLYLCSQKGLDCYGVEDSRALSSYASEKTGARIIQGLYDKDMFPQGYFDIIAFIQVLEHIPNPASALETARYHLRESGTLVIEVPSIHSPHFLAYEWTGIKRFVKPPDGVIRWHCGYYTPRSLATLTTRCGFKELSITTGRWKYKYTGLLGGVGEMMDPLLDALGVGGILYLGTPSPG